VAKLIYKCIGYWAIKRGKRKYRVIARP